MASTLGLGLGLGFLRCTLPIMQFQIQQDHVTQVPHVWLGQQDHVTQGLGQLIM